MWHRSECGIVGTLRRGGGLVGQNEGADSEVRNTEGYEGADSEARVILEKGYFEGAGSEVQSRG